MSLPQVECCVDQNSTPPKVTLTFTGTCNCELGHAIDPSVTTTAKKVQILSEKKKEKEITEESAKSAKMSLKERRKEEFLEKGIYTTLYGMLERKVKCASMCTDHLLNQKRDKLRRLLLSEEENYTKEYIKMCQAANLAREEELRRKALEVKAKLEREQRELAERKIKELKIQNFEPVRPLRSKIASEIVKKDQLWQIKEKYALQEAKREEERMYHDLMMKNLLEMREREEEEAKIQWMKQKEKKEIFMEQIKWKKRKDDQERELKEFERKQIEEAVKIYKEEEEREIETRRKRNAERIAEYKEYLARERETKEKRQKEEEEIDQAFTKLMLIEEEKEKQMKSSNKEALKREMAHYVESYKEMQRLKELDDKKMNQLIEELNATIRAQQDANRAKLKAAKRELFDNVMKERAEQLREKKEKERREEEARNNEIELLNLQIEQQRKIREEYERRMAEKRQEYGIQLKKQMMEFEEAKKRKKEEEKEYGRQIMLAEEIQRKELEEFMNSYGLPMHPMKELIMTQPPRFDGGLPCPK